MKKLVIHLMFCSVFCLAQQNHIESSKRFEFAMGQGITHAPMGLLGDMTNLTPAWNFTMGLMVHKGNDSSIAFRARMNNQSWFDSHHFRGTNNHRAKVSNTSATLGLMYFLSSPSLGDAESVKPYFCAEAGMADWRIHSSTLTLLDGSTYSKPIGGLYFGARKRKFNLEVGLVINFLETHQIDFKKYNSPNIAFTIGYLAAW